MHTEPLAVHEGGTTVLTPIWLFETAQMVFEHRTDYYANIHLRSTLEANYAAISSSEVRNTTAIHPVGSQVEEDKFHIRPEISLWSLTA